jgi:hypothetical protein
MAILGDKLIPILTDLVSWITKLTDWFSNLDEDQQKMLLTVLGIVAAIGPMLLVIGNLITVVQSLGAAFTLLSANPVAITIAAIIATLSLLYDMYKKVTGAANELNDISAGNTEASKQNIQTSEELTKKADTQKNKDFLINLYGNQLQRAVVAIKEQEAAILKAKKNPFTYPFVKDSLASGLKNYKAEASSLRNQIKELGGTPKLATGTNNVQRDGLAYLHQGEAVVPKKYNPAMGGGMMTLYIEQPPIQLDGKTVSRELTPYITKTVKVGGGNV